jgi:hypothetical protein
LVADVQSVPAYGKTDVTAELARFEEPVMPNAVTGDRALLPVPSGTK